MPAREQSIAIDTARGFTPLSLAGKVISAVEVLRVTFDDHTQPIQVEMGVARPHRFPRPLNEVAAFAERSFTLGPLELRAQTFVLVVHCYGHHVRITCHFTAFYCDQMMDKANESVCDISAQGPATGLPRNNQVPAR